MHPFAHLLPVSAFTSLLGGAIWIVRKTAARELGRRIAPDARTAQLRLISRRGLTPHHALHLVSVSGEVFVVATHPQGIQLLQLQSPRPVHTSALEFTEQESK